MDEKETPKADKASRQTRSIKIYQPIYTDFIGCTSLGLFLWQKTSQCHYFKVKFKQTLAFLDFSKLLD